MAEKITKLYIDNTGDDGDKKFADELKRRLRSLYAVGNVEVRTFLDLPGPPEDDINNELATVAAIDESDVVIPVISSTYIQFVTRRVEDSLRAIEDSSNRYLFPVILEEADWSNFDWIVRSSLLPRDSKPLSEKSSAEVSKVLEELVTGVKTVVQRVGVLASAATDSYPKEAVASGTEVFISHDHDDADFAELLKLRLEKEGIVCWLDTERLKIGQDWREEIDRGIENSAAVIAIMTPEARKSEYVTYEWAFAWGKGKKLFPIMLKQTQLHPRLESLQYLNFTDHSARPWNELLSSLKAAIGKL